MKNGIRFSLILAAAAAFTCAASSAQACEMRPGAPLARTAQYRTHKKTMPLAAFLANIKLGNSKTEGTPTATAEPPIYGLWTTAFVDGDQVEDAGFEAFAMGGTHMLNDPSPILTGNVCLGAWTQTAPLTYVVNHPAYIYDDQGVEVVGLVSIYEQVVLDAGGDSFQEQYKVVVADLDGNVLQTIDGQAVGKRVKAEDNPFTAAAASSRR